MFVVLSGRLRSVIKKTAIEEFGRGDVLGMVEVLQKKPRSTTVLAVRFSQLARVSEGMLSFVKMQFPQVQSSGVLKQSVSKFNTYRLDSDLSDCWGSTTTRIAARVRCQPLDTRLKTPLRIPWPRSRYAV